MIAIFHNWAMVVIGVGPLCSLGIVKYPSMSRFASPHYPCNMTVGFIFECQSFVQKLTISRICNKGMVGIVLCFGNGVWTCLHLHVCRILVFHYEMLSLFCISTDTSADFELENPSLFVCFSDETELLGFSDLS